MGRLLFEGEELDEKYLNRLELYKKRNKLSYRDLAKMFGLDVALMYRYCSGDRRPRLKTAKMIEEVTEGYIKPKHWGYKNEKIN